VRAWVWSDYLWNHRQEFFKNMPKSVVQSNWYYGRSFSRKLHYVQAYLDLQAHGYDQIPTGSNWSCLENFPRTVAFCRRNIDPRHLLGFLQTSWRPTLEVCRQHHAQAIQAAALARQKYPKA
jgi:hypothetical protein